jgi:hypothetical protein
MVRNLAGRVGGHFERGGTGEDYERNLWEGHGSGKGRCTREGAAAWPGEPCGRGRGCGQRSNQAMLEMRDGARTGDYPELVGRGSRGCQRDRIWYGVGPVTREIRLAQGRGQTRLGDGRRRLTFSSRNQAAAQDKRRTTRGPSFSGQTPPCALPLGHTATRPHECDVAVEARMGPRVQRCRGADQTCMQQCIQDGTHRLRDLNRGAWVWL